MPRAIVGGRRAMSLGRVVLAAALGALACIWASILVSSLFPVRVPAAVVLLVAIGTDVGLPGRAGRSLLFGAIVYACAAGTAVLQFARIA